MPFFGHFPRKAGCDGSLKTRDFLLRCHRKAFHFSRGMALRRRPYWKFRTFALGTSLHRFGLNFRGTACLTSLCCARQRRALPAASNFTTRHGFSLTDSSLTTCKFHFDYQTSLTPHWNASTLPFCAPPQGWSMCGTGEADPCQQDMGLRALLGIPLCWTYSDFSQHGSSSFFH